MTDFLLSQILAGIALGFGIISFQYKSRRSVLCWMAGSAVINACHFFVLGRPGPGTLYITVAIRTFAAAFSTDQKLMCLFLVLTSVGFFSTYRRPLGFLGLFGTLVATYGSFQRADQRIRILFMIAAATWTVHNVLAGTPVAAFYEAMLFTSNMIGYWRFYRPD
jgi:hypothetical protein